ncbi:MAG: hypothetical protein FWD62_15970 [Betaproteobacteria bacterium]|nr:hypothetical protein [Betaproteobacteria bacterium]
MRIRVTGILASEEIFRIVNHAMVVLEDKLTPLFANRSYGGNIDQLTVFVIAVDSDISENERRSKACNRVGSFKDMMTGEKVRDISIALPFNPDVIETMTGEQFYAAICAALISRSNDLGVKRLPKDFDRQKFMLDLHIATEAVAGSYSPPDD